MGSAVVVAVVVGLGGCSGGGGGGGGGSEEVSAPALSGGEALTVLRGWAERHNKAITSGDERLWREAVTGALALPVEARVRTYGKLSASAEISLVNPVFYVPRLGGSPKWFGVAALERSGGVEQQVLGVFVRSSGGWRAAHWLTFRGEPPRIAFDAEGYAIAVGDRGLPGAHAKYLARGDEGGVVPDAYSRNARVKGVGDWRGAAGEFTPGPGASYSLRTTDGGALVWYAVQQEQVVSGGTAAGLPVEVRDYLGGRAGKSVAVTWQWLAIGYAPASGKERVLGESVSLVSAR